LLWGPGGGGQGSIWPNPFGAVAGYRRIDALANEALALYVLDRRVEAAQIARTVVAKRPGQTNMRALLTTDQ